MAKGQELKRRIRSIGKTRQITRTMELVATSKLKRATDRVRAAKPYADGLRSVIGRLLDPELRERYPLLREPEEVRRAAVVLLTSNRGLAGAFNVNLIREARTLVERLRADGVDVAFHVVGKKGIGFFRFRGWDMASERTDIGDRPTVADAAHLVDGLMADFEAGRLDAVWVVYAQFRSALSTPPRAKKVLPVQMDAAEDDEDAEERSRWVANFTLSPSADRLLNEVLPLYVRSSMYGALVETSAAEQGARRTAMKNATDNAGEILDNLNRRYNRERQAQITQELAEIVGGSAALE
ncbi:MAG TPA: ATP synthase F1 subunit gamma [Longimicrobiales bacterium]|nr:ATP synthase F1 subunit gamma [Longimicrobiales bacterium]